MLSTKPTPAPVTEDQFDSPILKALVRDLLAISLPDCQNQKIVAKLAPLFHSIDQTVLSINGNFPKVGLSDYLTQLNTQRTNMQDILNSVAVDIGADPKLAIKCDAPIPKEVQQYIDALTKSSQQSEAVLKRVDQQLIELVAAGKTATPSQRVQIIQSVLNNVLFF